MEFLVRQLKSLNDDSFRSIGKYLCFLKKDYPDFLNWYNTKVMPNISTGQRQIYIANPSNDQGTIAGIMILKNTLQEKKICTLYVPENYRIQHIGTKFFYQAITALNTEKPLITISDKHIKEFEPLLQKFRFELYKVYPGYYQNTTNEYSYNGLIESCITQNAAA